jgi:hypothetical protein
MAREAGNWGSERTCHHDWLKVLPKHDGVIHCLANILISTFPKKASQKGYVHLPHDGLSSWACGKLMRFAGSALVTIIGCKSSPSMTASSTVWPTYLSPVPPIKPRHAAAPQ